jgi:hypothetical protein
MNEMFPATRTVRNNCFLTLSVAYKILAREHEGKRLHERPRCRWENNIKMDLRQIGCDNVEWIHLAQERAQSLALVNT